MPKHLDAAESMYAMEEIQYKTHLSSVSSFAPQKVDEKLKKKNRKMCHIVRRAMVRWSDVRSRHLLAMAFVVFRSFICAYFFFSSFFLVISFIIECDSIAQRNRLSSVFALFEWMTFGSDRTGDDGISFFYSFCRSEWHRGRAQLEAQWV